MKISFSQSFLFFTQTALKYTKRCENKVMKSRLTHIRCDNCSIDRTRYPNGYKGRPKVNHANRQPPVEFVTQKLNKNNISMRTVAGR